MHLSRTLVISLSAFVLSAPIAQAADMAEASASSAEASTSVSTPSLQTGIQSPIQSYKSNGAAYPNLSALEPNLGPNDLALGGLITEDTDLWGRIRKGFAIPDLDNQLVFSQTSWYAARPDYIQRTSLRASRYLYHVVEELEKRNMPTELALLPFIESAFNPEALSSAKASGMWQFMPSTGTSFNLKQNMFKDDRRDVLASTDAALTYLQRLYGMFGDWQLALAAYNWGEGSVQRAINRNRALGLPTDFNSLSARMPNETRNYVPKLQAVKNIIANPAYYNIKLPQVDNQPYFVSVDKTRDIDVNIAAQLAEMPLDEFRALNPQFNRPVIMSDTPILLPESNADKFRENLSNWGRALSSWTSHTITTAREKIETIAEHFGTTPDVLREVNHIPPRTHLAVGSTILVPKTEANADVDIAPDVAQNAKMQLESDAPDFRRVFVRAGRRDTLSSIAARNHVSVEQLKSWNNLHQDRIAAGQSLQVQIPFRGAVRRVAHISVSRSGRRVAAVSHPAHRKVVVASVKNGKKRPA
ncbi:MAG TPA: transglycosylase SLT domain-containing protein [Burkholderiaceae bacterium]|jgi:membrane-bound lytic murein transglycosylase D